MKSLAPNARAMGIAEACGKPTQVYGDVFMGRLYEDADDFVRLNFELKVRAATPPYHHWCRPRLPSYVTCRLCAYYLLMDVASRGVPMVTRQHA